ncbi:TIGR03749 family integrating conjugative element protein [Aggregatibacter actinomycetemcomitans]|uniref:TIGR03749 family integrating conjugative element protein n=1 Tax=Aggregatibacter actinomycetemcomitans TaxID=714 RepID=UPI00197B9533|nr:TIGR03749 family integrating conjugative element protein [Aggregatibacter actinomycetemcomitans]MBN6079269.1 TIGR03749 family integrating conjugative element protein [Aggregatibacter actinomycetemcomitans]
MKLSHYSLLSVGLLSLTTASADVLMKWERIPLQVGLEVEQERLIFVDKNVRAGYPASLQGKLRLQNSGGTVYLKATAPFDTTRIKLKDIATSENILLDIKTTDQKSREPIRLVYDKPVESNQGTSSRYDESVGSAELPTTTQPALPVPAALTRYAAQSLYAPLRTVEPLQGVQSVSTRLPNSLPTLLPGLPVQSTPIEAWALGGYVVTAIKITNQSHDRLTLDPRELQGRFYAATFQHEWISGKGSSSDTTTLYLITEGSADNAIVPAGRAYKSKHKVVKKIVKTTTRSVPVNTETQSGGMQ